MGGKINAYVDCVSPYSFFAFKYLREQRPLLSQHGVEVEFIPFFLGGVNTLSGNKPPWTLPAKAKYSPYDTKRASKYFGVPQKPTPEWFPILSLLPQRAMVYTKHHFPQAQYERAFATLWSSMWHLSPPLNVSQPAILAQVLSQTFSEAEVAAILEGANSAEVKAELLENTQQAVDRGAFGAPFCWVVRSDGDGGDESGEPFFGSDRFHFMWDYLRLPVQHLRIKSKEEVEEEEKGAAGAVAGKESGRAKAKI